MKENKVLSILTALLLLSAAWMITSCTKERTEIYIIENVEVKLNAKSAFSVTEETLRSVSHQYPASYKAYFISQENKGEYQTGQLVKTIDVTAGLQTIVVPKLKYTVYVTNYQKDGAWYTWNDAIEQLPLAVDELYLYGSNDIDYSTQLTGEVEANKIYKYTLNTDIPETSDDNNFNVIVEEFGETIEENLDIW